MIDLAGLQPRNVCDFGKLSSVQIFPLGRNNRIIGDRLAGNTDVSIRRSLATYYILAQEKVVFAVILYNCKLL